MRVFRMLSRVIGNALQGPNGCASRLKHPLNASVHFLFFDKFTSGNLVQADLNLCLEPFVMSE